MSDTNINLKEKRLRREICALKASTDESAHRCQHFPLGQVGGSGARASKRAAASGQGIVRHIQRVKRLMRLEQELQRLQTTVPFSAKKADAPKRSRVTQGWGKISHRALEPGFYLDSV